MHDRGKGSFDFVSASRSEALTALWMTNLGGEGDRLAHGCPGSGYLICSEDKVSTFVIQSEAGSSEGRSCAVDCLP
jgi:hypothetical protein